MISNKLYAKVKAINAYGESEISDPGSGDGIQLVPDAPVNLQNDATVTDDVTVGFNWQDGPSDGDSEILDYRVWYD